jgi:predicted nuclease of predicted toxin-antitoxin system
MKLLFDENLSFRLVAALADIYSESSHVREVGLLGADDLSVWNYAAEHGFLLASKDTDFYERSLVFGAPPKVIWLRIGNSTVNETITLLRSQYIVIRHFAEDTTATFLPLTQPKIAAM